MSTTLSVIIATYNAAGTLRRALDSVQRLAGGIDWECVVVDGSSTDGTVAILEEYAAAEPRIRYISEPDGGIYDAFNKGWRMARGRWVYYLGSDDELIAEGLQQLVQKAEADGAGCAVAYGNVIIRDPAGRTKEFVATPNYHKIRRVMFCGHQGLIMLRSAVESLGGFRTQYPLRADFDLVQRCYLAGGGFLNVPVAVAYFETGGATATWSLSRDLERLHILRANRSTRCPVFWFTMTFIRYRGPSLLPRWLRRRIGKLLS